MTNDPARPLRADPESDDRPTLLEAARHALNRLNCPASCIEGSAAAVANHLRLIDGVAVFVDGDGNQRTKYDVLGSGQPLPMSIDDGIRELCNDRDRGRDIRWRSFGSVL